MLFVGGVHDRVRCSMVMVLPSSAGILHIP
jgi:hypothetical protein